MKDTKMSICTTNANITGTNTIEEILKRIEKIEFILYSFKINTSAK